MLETATFDHLLLKTNISANVTQTLQIDGFYDTKKNNTIRYDTIEEINMDSKAEYTA